MVEFLSINYAQRWLRSARTSSKACLYCQLYHTLASTRRGANHTPRSCPSIRPASCCLAHLPCPSLRQQRRACEIWARRASLTTHSCHTGCYGSITERNARTASQVNWSQCREKSLCSHRLQLTQTRYERGVTSAHRAYVHDYQCLGAILCPKSRTSYSTSSAWGCVQRSRSSQTECH